MNNYKSSGIVKKSLVNLVQGTIIVIATVAGWVVAPLALPCLLSICLLEDIQLYKEGNYSLLETVARLMENISHPESQLVGLFWACSTAFWSWQIFC